jgi:hypothetical protein
VPSEQATTLAIALNELIANAIEHGFAGQVRGNIRVSGRRDGDMVVVRVADDGAGPPPGFDLTKQDGLGLQVVASLVRSDLHGSFVMERVAAADAPLADEAAGGGRADGRGGRDDMARGDAEGDTGVRGGAAGASAPGTRAGEGALGWTVAELRFPAMLAEDDTGANEVVDVAG